MWPFGSTTSSSPPAGGTHLLSVASVPRKRFGLAWILLFENFWMTDERHDGSFQEYRKLILAHMESSSRRQNALDDAITEIRVQMGVLVVKVGLLVGVLMLVGGTVATYVVSAAVTAAAKQIISTAESTPADPANDGR